MYKNTNYFVQVVGYRSLPQTVKKQQQQKTIHLIFFIEFVYVKLTVL